MEVLQVPSELGHMRALYRKHKPKRVLEIGCWEGGTLKEWLTIRAPEFVLAIDPLHRNEGSYASWKKRKTTLIVGTGYSQSQEMSDLIEEHAPYDWVFIDGDHDAGAVGQDVAICAPCVRKGGLMLLHDIAENENITDTGPHRAFDVLAQEHETWMYVAKSGVRFIDPPGPWPWAHGVGVVQF